MGEFEDLGERADYSKKKLVSDELQMSLWAGSLIFYLFDRYIPNFTRKVNRVQIVKEIKLLAQQPVWLTEPTNRRSQTIQPEEDIKNRLNPCKRYLNVSRTPSKVYQMLYEGIQCNFRRRLRILSPKSAYTLSCRYTQN